MYLNYPVWRLFMTLFYVRVHFITSVIRNWEKDPREIYENFLSRCNESLHLTAWKNECSLCLNCNNYLSFTWQADNGNVNPVLILMSTNLTEAWLTLSSEGLALCLHVCNYHTVLCTFGTKLHISERAWRPLVKYNCFQLVFLAPH